MLQLQQISLNTNWQYHFADQSDDYSSVTHKNSNWDWTTLTDFPPAEVSAHYGLWLRKSFDLHPTEACVRYFLCCDVMAYQMTIYLRGQVIVQCERGDVLDVDITDYVSLDDNVLVLAIRLDGQTIDAQPTELYLQPIYCDDLD